MVDLRIIEKNFNGGVGGVPFAPDLTNYGVGLAVEYGLGLLLVHQFAVFVGEEGTARTDLKFLDVWILLGGVDVTTLYVVGEEDRLGVDLLKESLQYLHLAPTAIAIDGAAVAPA